MHRSPPPAPSRKGMGRGVQAGRSKFADGRPSPDALLAGRQKGARGRLKIFLGAAPGVGKTYEMLSAHRARHREGVDVVVGVVETHGRARDRGAARRPRGRPAPGGRIPRPQRCRRWTSTRPRAPPAARRWSTSSRTPTRPAAGIRSATWMSRNCSMPASTSTRRSTSSTSKA